MNFRESSFFYQDFTPKRLDYYQTGKKIHKRNCSNIQNVKTPQKNIIKVQKTSLSSNSCKILTFHTLTLLLLTWCVTSSCGNNITAPEMSQNIDVNIVLKLFKDQDFSDELSQGVAIETGSFIYAQLSTTTLASGVYLLAEECRASPSDVSDVTTSEALLDYPGCPAGNHFTTVIANGNLDRVRFRFRAFKFRTSSTISMQCTATLHLTDQSPNCGLRRKRSTGEARHFFKQSVSTTIQ